MIKAVFWDLDGTLIDSEPYWHESELDIARRYGGYWDLELAQRNSGSSLLDVASRMIERGTQCEPQRISDEMVSYVAAKESQQIPWVDGVCDVLTMLAQHKIPCIVVTTSPRVLAANVLEKDTTGAFVGYICGDDVDHKKPHPEPYLKAASLLDIHSAKDLQQCVAFEDSAVGLTSAYRAGMTTIAQTAYINVDASDSLHDERICGYNMVTLDFLEQCVQRKMG